MLQPKKRFWGKRPGFDMGDILHIAVNVIFVAALYSMVIYWDLVVLAVVLVFLSKWRVLAVQPRFWLPNIRANLVDVIVGVSTVILTFQAAHTWIAIMWAFLYLLWLLFLKPQSQESWVALQAFCAQSIGLIAIFSVPTFMQHALVMCLFTWLIAWSAARHFFTNYEEAHYRSLGLIWGFLMTQLVWVALHWTQYYELFDIKIALIIVVISILSASLGSVYHAYKQDKLQKSVLIENGLFATTLLLVILATADWAARL